MSQYYRAGDHNTRNCYPIKEIPVYSNTQQRNFLYRSNDVIEIKIPVDYLVSILAILGLYFLRTQNLSIGTFLPLLTTKDGNTEDLIKQVMDILSPSLKKEKMDLGSTQNMINKIKNQGSDMKTPTNNIDPSNIADIVKEVMGIVDNLDLKSIKN